MDKQARISVVIPLYNNKTYIEECIESVIGQTLQPQEIIVVDDGSVDGGGDLAAKYQQVTLLTQGNSGVTAARRTGVRHATGEWIYFLDSDDTLEPQALEHLAARTADGTDIVASDAPYERSLTRDEYIEALFKTEIRTGPICKLIRRSLFADGYALDMPREIVRGEDMLMNIRLAYRVNGKIETIREMDYNYRAHAGQTVASFATSTAFETMFYRELCASFSKEDYQKFLPGLIRSRIYAYHLILSRQKETKDYGVKQSEWYQTLLDDIARTGYRLSAWEWMVMRVANRHTIKYICFAFSLPGRIARKLR